MLSFGWILAEFRQAKGQGTVKVHFLIDCIHYILLLLFSVTSRHSRVLKNKDSNI